MKKHRKPSWGHPLFVAFLVPVFFFTACQKEPEIPNATKDVPHEVPIEVEYLILDGKDIEMPDCDIFEFYNLVYDEGKWQEEGEDTTFTHFYKLTELNEGPIFAVNEGDPEYEEFVSAGKDDPKDNLYPKLLEHFDSKDYPSGEIATKDILAYVHYIYDYYKERYMVGVAYFITYVETDQQGACAVAAKQLQDDWHNSEPTEECSDPWPKVIKHVTAHEIGHTFLIRWNYYDPTDPELEHHCPYDYCIMYKWAIPDPEDCGYPQCGFCDYCRMLINANVWYNVE